MAARRARWRCPSTAGADGAPVGQQPLHGPGRSDARANGQVLVSGSGTLADCPVPLAPTGSRPMPGTQPAALVFEEVFGAIGLGDAIAPAPRSRSPRPTGALDLFASPRSAGLDRSDARVPDTSQGTEQPGRLPLVRSSASQPVPPADPASWFPVNAPFLWFQIFPAGGTAPGGARCPGAALAPRTTSERPEHQERRDRHRDDQHLQRQAHPPVIAEPVAAGARGSACCSCARSA
jgi:hypothetical protein